MDGKQIQLGRGAMGTRRGCAGGLQRILAASIAILVTSPAAAAIAQAPPTNVPVTDQPTTEQQRAYQAPTIAHDPARPGRLAISYHDQRSGVEGGCFLALSANGGTTWQTRRLIGQGGAFPIPDPYIRCSRPTITFAPDGSLYYAYTVFRQVPGRRFGGYSTLFLTSSRDGGATFTAPLRVDPNQPPPDVFESGVGDVNPRLAVDKGTGRVYIAWHRASTDFYSNADGFVASSPAGGQTFSTPVKVDPDPQKANLVIPAVGPDGRVYVAYQDLKPFTDAGGAGPANLFVVSSTNGGASFSAPVNVATMNFGACADFGCQQDAAGNYTRSPYHDLEAGSVPGQVFVVASWYRPGAGANRSELWASSNGGSSWTGPRGFGIPAGGEADGQLLPSLSLASNRLDIAYYNLDNTLEDTYLTTTTNGGQTFSTPRRISGTSSNTDLGPTDDFGNDAYGGGTALVSSVPGGAYLAWTDSRRSFPLSDKLDIFFSSTVIPAGTPSPPPPVYPQPSAPFTGCPALTANVIRGTAAADTITGTVRGDRIFAGTGDDVVDALAGDDCVSLGTGDDRGQGGLGNDLILGGLGKDRISGSSGNDRLFGSRGRDKINGGSGKDTISGGSSNDRVAGKAGNDRINGNSGNDVLKGNSGNDRIKGSTGRDRISGGSGKDRIDVRDGHGGDRVSCGIGRDRVIADRGDRIARDCERVKRG